MRRTAESMRGLMSALRDDEQGDVPGWVLVTLMTAGLVVVIWALAGPALSNLFEQAIARVSGL
ncbi:MULTISPECIES: hypothetical protein [Microbacterium]|uniref:hypothetical protein n=1 Tax=Microbacterium TaxID=33882 RepID=UPI00117EFCC8|nr:MULTISPECIES: hypothetical protein [Microbacterium]MDQ1216394.1 hypothetical protein [Microbacterium arborescens]